MSNEEDGVWNTLISFNFCFIFKKNKNKNNNNLLAIVGIHTLSE